jgi:hypothetical protein
MILDTLAKIICAMDREQFAEGYPGLYLLAMGFLSSEEIAARSSMASMAAGRDREETLPLKFGQTPKHDLRQPHPLAGRLFYFRQGGGGGEEEYLTLGRSSSCDIRLPEPSVSEEHCRVQVLPEGLVVMDLGSTNGTSINLERLGPDRVELLADGDMLTVGRYSFQLMNASTLHATMSLIRALDDES